MMDQKRLLVGPAPHLRGPASVPRIMADVIIALMPAVIWAIYIFGPAALMTLLTAILGAVVIELLWQRMTGQPVTIGDGSALLTGVILALNLPANLPWWMTLGGTLAAIILGKQLFGGLGNNPFNPAAVGRVFLLLSFPVAMSAKWLAVHDLTITSATPLGVLKNSGAIDLPSYRELFFGVVGGSMGEVSVLLLLLGAGYLLWRRVISWHIPASFLATMVVVALPFWLNDPIRFASPLFHILSGGAVIGAFFMATDMVTVPSNLRAQVFFGCGCGLLTMMIRLWGGYPEGVSFAILLMNAVGPLLERLNRPRRFGQRVDESHGEVK